MFCIIRCCTVLLARPCTLVLSHVPRLGPVYPVQQHCTVQYYNTVSFARVLLSLVAAQRKDSLLDTATAYPLFLVQVHPPTLKAVPSEFDPNWFTSRRAIDPLYTPRMVSRTATVVQPGVYQGPTLLVHLVDDVLPYLNTSFLDSPSLTPIKRALPSGVYSSSMSLQGTSQYCVVLSSLVD